MAFENLFVRVKRTLGGVQLDGVIVETHDTEVTTTDNPVESGKTISDHAVIQPKKLQLKAIVSDTPLGVAAFAKIVDTITGIFGTSTSSNSTRTQQAYGALVKLQEAREPLVVVTKLKTYDNLIITKINVSQDKDTSLAAFLNISLKEVIVTSSEIVALTEDDLKGRAKKQGSTPVQSGTNQPTSVDDTTKSSILVKIGKLF